MARRFGDRITPKQAGVGKKKPNLRPFRGGSGPPGPKGPVGTAPKTRVRGAPAGPKGPTGKPHRSPLDTGLSFSGRGMTEHQAHLGIRAIVRGHAKSKAELKHATTIIERMTLDAATENAQAGLGPRGLRGPVNVPPPHRSFFDKAAHTASGPLLGHRIADPIAHWITSPAFHARVGWGANKHDVSPSPLDIASVIPVGGLGLGVGRAAGRVALRDALAVSRGLRAAPAVARAPRAALDILRARGVPRAASGLSRLSEKEVRRALYGRAFVRSGQASLAAQAPAAVSHHDVGQFGKALTNTGAMGTASISLAKAISGDTLPANYYKNLVNLPANVIPMVYMPLHAIWNARLHNDPEEWNALKKSFFESDFLGLLSKGKVGEALHAFHENPLFTQLEVTGVLRGTSRGMGTVARGIERAAGRVGVDELGNPRGRFATGVGSRPAGIGGETRTRAPGLVGAEIQRVQDHIVERARRSAGEEPTGFLGRVMKWSEPKLVKRSELRTVRVRSAKLVAQKGQEHEHAIKVLGRIVRIAGKKNAPIVHFAIEGTANPGTFVDDLVRLRDLYIEARDEGLLPTDEAVANNAYRVKSIDRAIAAEDKHPGSIEAKAMKAREAFIEALDPKEQRLITDNILNEERGLRAQESPEAVVHGGSRYVPKREAQLQHKGTTVADAVDAKREATRKVQSTRDRKRDLRRKPKPKLPGKGRKLPKAGTKARAEYERKVAEREDHIAEADAAHKKAREDLAAADKHHRAVLKTNEKIRGYLEPPRAPEKAPDIHEVFAMDRPGGSYTDPLAHQIEAIDKALSPEARAGLNSWLLSAEEGMDPAIAAELHAAYEPVRAALRERFGDTVKLWRGQTLSVELGRPGRELLSFTTSKVLAAAHAEGKIKGHLLEMDVPVDRITAITVGTDTPYNEFFIKVHPEQAQALLEGKTTLLWDTADKIDGLSGVIDDQIGPIGSKQRNPNREVTGRGRYISQIPEEEANIGGTIPAGTKVPGISRHTREGRASYWGSSEGSFRRLYTTLVSRGNLGHVVAYFRQLTDEHGHGTFGSEAEAVKPSPWKAALTARHGKLVPVRQDPMRDLAAEATDLEGLSEDSLMRLQEGGTNLLAEAQKSGPGTWTLVPEYVIKEVNKQQAPGASNFATKGIGVWKTALLPTSPHWIPGNFIDISIRGFTKGLLPSVAAFAQPAHWEGKRALRILGDEGQGIVPGGPITAIGEGGMSRPSIKGQAVADQLHKPLSDAVMELKTIRSNPITQTGPAIVNFYKAYAKTIFVSNHLWIERPSQVTLLGRVHKQHLRNVMTKQEAAIEKGTAAYEDMVRGHVDTEAQVAYARAIHETFGNWNVLRAGTRHTLTHYAPFMLWAAAAARFVFLTLPGKHPVLTGLIATAGSMTKEDRMRLGFDLFSPNKLPDWLMGSIPTKAGLRTTSNYTSFGVFANAPLGLIQFLVPPLHSFILAQVGKDWRGQDIKDADGNVITDHAALTRYAIATAVEPFLPFLPLLSRITPVGGILSGTPTKRASLGQAAIPFLRSYDGGGGASTKGSSAARAIGGSAPLSGLGSRSSGASAPKTAPLSGLGVKKP